MLAITTAVVLAAIPAIKMALSRARETVEIRNIRSLKFVLDSFAMDNEGTYPNEDTAEFYGIPRSTSSNDLLRQLFASGNTNGESIFWSADSKVWAGAPPDLRQPDPAP